MILAAAICAEENGPPPPELAAYWRFKEYGISPRSGGQDVHPAGLLDRMTAAANVYYAWKGLKQAPRKISWQREHPEQWKTCVRILELRKGYAKP